MRRLTVGLLYIIVAALVSVPPLFAMFLLSSCGDQTQDCHRGIDSWFEGAVALIWLPPLVAVIPVLIVIFRLRRG